MMEYTDTEDGSVLTIEPCSEWVNYGDVNPKSHGGKWVRFNGDMWKVIETRNGYDYPHISDDQHEIVHTWIEPYDLFVHGNPNEGPTDVLQSVISSLASVNGYEHALVDFPIEYFVAGITHYRHFKAKTAVVDSTDYWETLAEYGISQ